jgi:hypothetical protein
MGAVLRDPDGRSFFSLAILSLPAPWFVHSRYVLCKPCGGKERERGVHSDEVVYRLSWERAGRRVCTWWLPSIWCRHCLHKIHKTGGRKEVYNWVSYNLSSSPSQTIRMKMQWNPTHHLLLLVFLRITPVTKMEIVSAFGKRATSHALKLA